MPTIRPLTTDADRTQFLTLTTTYLRWHVADYNATLGLTVDAETFVAEQAAKLGQFEPPQGLAWLAFLSAEPAGTIGLRWHDPATAEIKRLYVTPAARGTGTARTLVATAIAAARKAGGSRVLLDTFETMTAAQQLYRSLGFHERDAYPQSDIPADVGAHFRFFELDCR